MTIVTLSETQSVILYVFSVLLCISMMRKAQKYDSKVLLWIVIVFLSCIIGFRYNVGKDYGNYSNAYNIITAQPTIAAAHKWYSIEESFYVISFLSKMLGGTSQYIFLFYGFFTTMFFLNGLWYFRNEIRIEWAAMSYCILFFGSFNTIRQYLAMSIIFWGFRFVVERKPIKYLMCVLVALFFHTSAFVAVLIYFYGTQKSMAGKAIRKFNYILPFVLVIGTNKILAVLQKIGGGRLDNYTVRTHFGFGIVIQFAILWLFLHSSNQGNNSLLADNNKHFFVKQIIILSTILCILDYTLGDASRIRNYFSTIEMIVFGSLPSSIFKNNTNERFPVITYSDAFMLIYFFMFLFMGFINRDSWIYPYSCRL